MSTALAHFVAEIGAEPVLIATDGNLQHQRKRLEQICPEVIDDADYNSFEKLLKTADAQMVLGSSRCYPSCRRLNLPLLRVGFPVQDRFGSASIQHLGYAGCYDLTNA